MVGLNEFFEILKKLYAKMKNKWAIWYFFLQGKITKSWMQTSNNLGNKWIFQFK